MLSQHPWRLPWCWGQSSLMWWNVIDQCSGLTVRESAKSKWQRSQSWIVHVSAGIIVNRNVADKLFAKIVLEDWWFGVTFRGHSVSFREMCALNSFWKEVQTFFFWFSTIYNYNLETFWKVFNFNFSLSLIIEWIIFNHFILNSLNDTKGILYFNGRKNIWPYVQITSHSQVWLLD